VNGEAAGPVAREADHAGFLAVVSGELPSGVLDLDEAARSAVATDRASRLPQPPPVAVVRPRSASDVSVVLAAANRFGVPVVTRGAGTGLSGGAWALPAGIVLDMSGMDRIVEIDPAGAIAVVQPGVITAALDEAAAAHGLAYAPDPASAAISTIGGNIATNAGGLRFIKYGSTRQAVLGLTVVLPSGEIVTLGGRTRKNVTGLDLCGLMVGSEGTLGVVVEATLALVPRAVDTAMLAVTCRDWSEVQRCVLAVASSGVTPSLFELMDRGALRVRGPAALSTIGAPADPLAVLLVQTDGVAAVAELARLEEALSTTGAWVSPPLAATDAALMVALRRGETLPGYSDPQVGGADEEWWLGEDMAIPATRLSEYFAAADAASRALGVGLSLVAHVGDGNLHPSLTVRRDSLDEGPAQDLLHRAADALIRIAIDLGGTLTGEHGVGVLKRPWLPLVLSPTVLELHRGVKAAFDPNDIMNPGRAY
jgi:glycolate oxidase